MALKLNVLKEFEHYVTGEVTDTNNINEITWIGKAFWCTMPAGQKAKLDDHYVVVFKDGSGGSVKAAGIRIYNKLNNKYRPAISVDDPDKEPVPAAQV